MVINDFAPPVNGGNMRIYKMAKYLNKHGWQVFILCNAINKKQEVESDDRLKMELDGVIIHNIPSYFKKKPAFPTLSDLSAVKKPFVYYVKNVLGKLYATISKYAVPDTQRILWIQKAIPYATKLVRENNIPYLITSSPPHSTQLIGSALKKIFKNKIHWVADYRDMWSLSHVFELDYSRGKFRHLALERKLLTQSDKNIFVSEGIMKKTLEHFNIPGFIKKSRVITNGFDADDFSNLGTFDLLPEKKINFSYVGTISGPQMHTKLIEAIAGFENKEPFNDLHFNFAGEFNKEVHTKLKTLKSVTIYPKLKHREGLNLMNSSDVLILILTNDEEGKVAFSGKFFEYLKIGKPILALVPEGEVSRIIRKYRLGIIANPENENEIIEAISEISTRKDFNVSDDTLLKSFEREELCYQLESFILEQ